MTKDEYLADLATKVVFVDSLGAGPANESKPVGNYRNSNEIVAAVDAGEIDGMGRITLWTVRVLTIGPIGVYTEQNVAFRVVNYGTPAESAFPQDRIENPLADVIEAVTYWETLKADPASPIVAYREIPGEDKRSDLGFYPMKVWEWPTDENGLIIEPREQLLEKVVLQFRHPDGTADHKEIA